MDKRFILKTSALMFSATLLACVVTGCGERDIRETEKVTAKGAWSVEQVSLINEDFTLSHDNFISNVGQPVYANNHLYYVIYPDDAAVEIQGISIDNPKEPITYVSFPREKDTAIRIDYLQYNENGSLTYLKEVSPQFEFDYLTQSEEEILEASKKEQESIVTLETVFIEKDKKTASLDVSDTLSGFSAMSCVSDGKDTLYLGGFYTDISDSGDIDFDKYMIVLNMKSGKAEKIKALLGYANMVTSGNGEIFEVVSVGKKMSFKPWDKEKKEFSLENKVVCDRSEEYGYIGCYAGLGNTILYLDNGNLYQCDMKSKETELLLTLSDWDIVGTDNLLVSAVDKDTLYVFLQASSYDYDFDISSFCLTAVEPSDLPEKTELVLTCKMADNYTKELIADFNRGNQEYHIKIEEISEYQGPQIVSIDDLESLESDLEEDVFYNTVMAGNAGDLILLSDLKGIVDNAELFEDLYPYITCDAQLSKRNLNTNLLRLCEMDGKLVTLPAYYYLNYLSCDAQILGEDMLTIDKFLEIINKNPDKIILHGILQDEMMKRLFYYNIEYFIDFQEETCRFTDGVFEKILLAMKGFLNYEEMSQENAENGYISDVTRVKEGRQLFYESDLVVGEQYQTLKALFGENLRISGYPGIEEEKIPAVISDTLFAINKNSNQKEACFEFIKYVFEHRVQFGNTFVFPIDNDILKEKIAKAVKETKDEELDMYDGTILAVDALTEQDEKAIFELINSVNVLAPTYFYIPGISEILDEETEKFFNGNKTAAETCAALDNKISDFLQKREK